MAQIPSVVADTVITSAWGNAIRDRGVQIFANAAERDLALPVPFAGQVCWSDNRKQVYVSGAVGWRVDSPSLQTLGTVAAVNPLNTAGQALGNVVLNLPVRTWVHYVAAVYFTPLDALGSLWTIQLQATGATTLNPVAQVSVPNNTATWGIVSVGAFIDVPANAAATVQMVATRSGGTGTARTFAQTNAVIATY